MNYLKILIFQISYFETFAIGTASSKIASKFQFHPRIQVFRTVCGSHSLRLFYLVSDFPEVMEAGL